VGEECKGGGSSFIMARGRREMNTHMLLFAKAAEKLSRKYFHPERLVRGEEKKIIQVLASIEKQGTRECGGGRKEHLVFGKGGHRAEVLIWKRQKRKGFWRSDDGMGGGGGCFD